jgi:hypothetical protein
MPRKSDSLLVPARSLLLCSLSSCGCKARKHFRTCGGNEWLHRADSGRDFNFGLAPYGTEFLRANGGGKTPWLKTTEVVSRRRPLQVMQALPQV